MAQVPLELLIEGNGGWRRLDMHPVRVVPTKDEIARGIGHARLGIAQDDLTDDLRIGLQRPQLGAQVGPDQLQE